MLTSRSGLAVHDVPHVCGEYELGLVRLLALKRLEQNLTQLKEIGLPRRGRTPSQPNVASRLRLDKAKELHALVAHLDAEAAVSVEGGRESLLDSLLVGDDASDADAAEAFQRLSASSWVSPEESVGTLFAIFSRLFIPAISAAIASRLFW